MVKCLSIMRETQVRAVGWEDTLEKWQSTPVLLPRKSHGQRSLVGYSLWGCKESDTTERLHFTTLHFTTLHFTSLLVPERKGYDSQWQDSFTSGEGNYLNLHRNFNHIYCAFLVTFHNCFPLSQYPSFVFSWSWYLKYQLVPSGRILTFPFPGISHLYLGYRWQ